ncbi:MAG TPA: SDR family oxidoreductase [Bacteroidota bacterium]|nr:SDR family oxidoreductase [Bacteroidota bacterium]
MPLSKLPIVWVTGASRGIGLAIAKEFSRTGACVILSGRNIAALRRNVTAIERSGGCATAVRCDISSERSVSRAYALIRRKHAGVDVLVNNAGVTYFKNFSSTTVKDLDHVIATNLRGMFLCTKAVLPAMLRKRHGFIITIGSVSATTTFVNASAYSASKAGMLAMSRVLRAEVRKKGIRVIDVLPGAVDTEMWGRSERKKFSKRMMQPKDIADVVVSLFKQPTRVLTEEIVIRPVEGDL